MTPKRREQILAIADGNPQTFPILHQLDHFVHADKMFDWLIKNRITGKTLVDLIANEFQHSWLTFGKWVIMRVNKDNEMKKVIAGRDFKTNSI